MTLRPGRRSAGQVPLWALPFRAVAVVVVVPVRLLWEILVAVRQAAVRYVLVPLGEFIERYLLRPLGWLLYRAVLRPMVWLVAWLVATLVLLPAVWLGLLVWRRLVWLYRVVLAPSGHRLGQLLGWLWRGVVRLLRILAGRLRPAFAVLGRIVSAVARFVADTVVVAWRVAGRLLRWLYRWTLRPIGLALTVVGRRVLVPVGRAVRWIWSATVVRTRRWLRRVVFAPVAAAVDTVLVALDLRRSDPGVDRHSAGRRPDRSQSGRPRRR